MQRILVPVDGSEIARRGLDFVKRLTDSGLDAEVLILCAPEPPVDVGDYASAEVIVAINAARHRNQQAVIAEASETARGLGLRFTTIATRGNVLDDVVAEVERWKADLVVIGTHGRSGVRRLLLGSVAQRILHAVDVPVTLVR